MDMAERVKKLMEDNGYTNPVAVSEMVTQAWKVRVLGERGMLFSYPDGSELEINITLKQDVH